MMVRALVLAAAAVVFMVLLRKFIQSLHEQPPQEELRPSAAGEGMAEAKSSRQEAVPLPATQAVRRAAPPRAASLLHARPEEAAHPAAAARVREPQDARYDRQALAAARRAQAQERAHDSRMMAAAAVAGAIGGAALMHHHDAAAQQDLVRQEIAARQQEMLDRQQMDSSYDMDDGGAAADGAGYDDGLSLIHI